MESRRVRRSRKATDRARHLLDALGFGDEVMVRCIDHGDRLECRLAISSSAGHHFLLRFWTDPRIDWAALGRKCLDALEALLAQRDRLLLSR